MQCLQHPSETPNGVCASCLAERLTDLLQLQRDRYRVPFSQPLPASSTQHNTEGDHIKRTHSVASLTVQEDNERTRTIQAHQFTEKKPVREKFSFLSRFKQGPQKNQAGRKKESGEDTHKARVSAWIWALLPKRHREKKTGTPAAPAAAKSSTNPSFLSARSSERSPQGADFVGRDEAFHDQFANSGPGPGPGPVAYELEGYYSDSDLRKGRIYPRVKREGKNYPSSSSTTARVKMFSESEEEEEESRRSTPQADPPRRENGNSYFSGVFTSRSPKSKGWVHNHADCAGSFSPYTDRRLQSLRPFSMAGAENSGFAFCPTPRKLFHREISRSPRRGGKLSNFFLSPSRRM